MTRSALSLSCLVLSTLLGCTDGGHVGVGGPQGSSDPTPTGLKASTDDSCKSGSDLVGCPCDSLGETHACGACGDGQQVCTAYGEFDKWSPCDGASDSCSTGSPNTPSTPGGDWMPPVVTTRTPPAGVPGAPQPSSNPTPTPSASPSPSPSPSAPPCECVPGATRWCDEPVYCAWGQQTCAPDGTWGSCVEVNLKPTGCTSDGYDSGCCVTAGECCQDSSVAGGPSIGNCSAIICS